jgi:pSer/pThr/pTyr-binding forkhead associated (FHA) protein
MSTIVLRALDATIGVGPFTLRDGEQTDVGRSADCSIALPSKSVSRVHARFLRKGADLVLEDLGSSNGTTVNGSPIHGAVTVRAGDHIRFGSLEFVLDETKAAEDEAATILAPPNDPHRDAPTTPSPTDATPTPTPVTAQMIEGAPPPSAAEPVPPTREVRSVAVANERDPAAAPTAKTTRDQPAAAGPASPIELALIAAGAYVAVVAAGLAIRWVFG